MNFKYSKLVFSSRIFKIGNYTYAYTYVSTAIDFQSLKFNVENLYISKIRNPRFRSLKFKMGNLCMSKI